MNSPVIEIDNVSFSYGTTRVLKNASLSLARNEFLAVIGPNGGGKSTLLKLILGLLEPDQGTIRILGLPPREGARHIGYVPQNPNIQLDFPVSVLDVVRMGRLGCPRVRDREIVEQSLETMQVSDKRRARIGELSSGERQRVFIARALATEPSVLLLDEPTASIDTEGQTLFYQLLKSLNKNLTIILVSHDVSLVTHYVTSVACINQSLYYHPSPDITEEMLKMVYEDSHDLIVHHHHTKGHKGH